jgi:uncharacterized protein (DUF2267 family)
MSTTGLDVFDKTVQTTNIWLKEIMTELGCDRRHAYRALGAVLRTLRDRLTVDEAAQLGDQLPILVRGLYYDQWHSATNPDRTRKLDVFLGNIASALADLDPMDPEEVTRVVFAVLAHHVADGEIDQVKHMLPSDIQRLWP